MFEVRLETRTDPFEHEKRAHEVARILRDLADRITLPGESLAEHTRHGLVRDADANVVGRWTYQADYRSCNG